MVTARARLLAASCALLAACAPDASDRVVTLAALSPEAQADRDARLQGRTPRTPPPPVGVAAVPAAEVPSTVSASPAAAPAQAAIGPVPQVGARTVPARPRSTGGNNVVAFALATSHPVGAAIYERNGGSDAGRDRACARYQSDDFAQAAFLEAGGPAADPRGMDPDGDGYACGWNPERFRRAVR